MKNKSSSGAKKYADKARREREEIIDNALKIIADPAKYNIGYAG